MTRSAVLLWPVKSKEATPPPANVKTIGFSFGGGCFFENGLGTTNGTGTFTLDSFDVS